MKNTAILIGILFFGLSAKSSNLDNNSIFRGNYDGSAFIFVEGNVEFSVFPDGQFDFIYLGQQKQSQVVFSSPKINVSFNSGYNYDTYVQYDMYGAVIQIESVPVYYDEYGRITRAGNVNIRYNDRRIVNVGGLRVFYNNYGYFSHCTGHINVWTPSYVYHPWHAYYARPVYTHIIVYDFPYRRYYTPVRYNYHDHVVYYKNRNNVAYQNGRRDFYRPGSRIHRKDGQVRVNSDFNPNRPNTMVASTGRNSSGEIRTSNTRDTRENPRNVRNSGNTSQPNDRADINIRTARTGTSEERNHSVPNRSGNMVNPSPNAPIRETRADSNSRTVTKSKTPSANSRISRGTQTPRVNRNSSTDSKPSNSRTTVRNNPAGNSPSNSTRQNHSVRTRG